MQLTRRYSSTLHMNLLKNPTFNIFSANLKLFTTFYSHGRIFLWTKAIRFDVETHTKQREKAAQRKIWIKTINKLSAKKRSGKPPTEGKKLNSAPMERNEVEEVKRHKKDLMIFHRGTSIFVYAFLMIFNGAGKRSRFSFLLSSLRLLILLSGKFKLEIRNEKKEHVKRLLPLTEWMLWVRKKTAPETVTVHFMWLQSGSFHAGTDF